MLFYYWWVYLFNMGIFILWKKKIIWVLLFLFNPSVSCRPSHLFMVAAMTTTGGRIFPSWEVSSPGSNALSLFLFFPWTIITSSSTIEILGLWQGRIWSSKQSYMCLFSPESEHSFHRLLKRSMTQWINKMLHGTYSYFYHPMILFILLFFYPKIWPLD